MSNESLIHRPVTKYRSKGIALSTFTTVLMAVMPKCPLCWIALMSTLGVGSIVTSYWMQPVAISVLLLPLAVFLLCAHRSRSYAPFYLALAAAVAMYACKFRLNSDAGVYLSGATMLGASVWNALLTRQAANKTSTETKCHC